MLGSTMPVDWSVLYHGTLPWVPQRTIFLTRAGSHAYGLATAESDLGLRKVRLRRLLREVAKQDKDRS